MATSDILGGVLFVGFGLWWVIFPRSVINFYRWFHRGGLGSAQPIGIRIVGVAWIALVLIVMALRFCK